MVEGPLAEISPSHLRLEPALNVPGELFAWRSEQLEERLSVIDAPKPTAFLPGDFELDAWGPSRLLPDFCTLTVGICGIDLPPPAQKTIDQRFRLNCSGTVARPTCPALREALRTRELLSKSCLAARL